MDEEDWMRAAHRIIARLDDAKSVRELDVIEASTLIKPELDRMATTAPQQHRAVSDFIAEKRQELGG